MDNLSRRAFLGRGGALAAALVALQANPAFLAEALGAAPDLGEAELATYAALIAALGEVEGTKVDAKKTDVATDTLLEWFGAQEEETRRLVVTLLRNVEDGPDGAKFSKHGKSDALKVLRRWHRARTPAEREFEAKARSRDAEGHPRHAPGGDNQRAFERYVEDQRRELARRAREIEKAHGAWVLQPDPVTGLPPYKPDLDDSKPKDWPDESKERALKERLIADAALGLASLHFYSADDQADERTDHKQTASAAI